MPKICTGKKEFIFLIWILMSYGIPIPNLDLKCSLSNRKEFKRTDTEIKKYPKSTSGA